MAQIPYQPLNEIIRRYGQVIIQEPRRVKGLLLDFCGGQMREVNLLIHALNEKIPETLLNPGNIPGFLLRARLVKHLQDHHGMAEDAAQWAVEAWNQALGGTLPPLPKNTPDLPPKPIERPVIAQPHTNEIKINIPDLLIELVRVPAGKFLMGAADSNVKAMAAERPQHSVHLDEYWIGKYPVTNAQYQAYVHATKVAIPGHWNHGQIPRGKENHPVVNISWNDAIAFCAWLSQESRQPFRLPTESEWEKAARGMDGKLYPWGNQEADESLANYGEKVGDTTVVGKYLKGASPYGALDMAGNVWEWCSDWYDEKYYQHSPANNPQGATSGKYRVLRGGGWDNYVELISPTFRGRNSPVGRGVNCGFRCCCVYRI